MSNEWNLLMCLVLFQLLNSSSLFPRSPVFRVFRPFVVHVSTNQLLHQILVQIFVNAIP